MTRLKLKILHDITSMIKLTKQVKERTYSKATMQCDKKDQIHKLGC